MASYQLVDSYARFLAQQGKESTDTPMYLGEYLARTHQAEAVRMPLGLPFDHELDAEVTGEEVADGTIIASVTSLGYYFEGSRNGGYRTLAKVII